MLTDAFHVLPGYTSVLVKRRIRCPWHCRIVDATGLPHFANGRRSNFFWPFVSLSIMILFADSESEKNSALESHACIFRPKIPPPVNGV